MLLKVSTRQMMTTPMNGCLHSVPMMVPEGKAGKAVLSALVAHLSQPGSRQPRFKQGQVPAQSRRNLLGTLKSFLLWAKQGWGNFVP